MYDPPGYLWALTIAGMIAIPAATCVVLYGGATRRPGPEAAALLAGARPPCSAAGSPLAQ